MENPYSISVIIPACNAGKTLRRAIQSVLNQTRPAAEIVVVDDGSVDDTAPVAGSFGGRIRLICRPNAGVSAARNTGILAATGRWVAFLDADDEWMPDYLESQTGLLNCNPQVVWSMANFYTACPEEHRRAAFLDPSAAEKKSGGRQVQPDFLACWCRDVRGHLNTTMIRRDVVEKTGLFDTSLPLAEDLDLWLRMAYQSPEFGYICRPLAVYYVSTAGSLTKKMPPVDLFVGFIRRHLSLSQEYHRREAFEPVASCMMKLWIRGMLFEGRGSDIQRLIREFPDLFLPSYKVWADLVTCFPSWTAWGCRMISRVVRLLRLRRRVVAPPQKQ